MDGSGEMWNSESGSEFHYKQAENENFRGKDRIGKKNETSRVALFTVSVGWKHSQKTLHRLCNSLFVSLNNQCTSGRPKLAGKQPLRELEKNRDCQSQVYGCSRTQSRWIAKDNRLK